jgi:adenylate cyclase
VRQVTPLFALAVKAITMRSVGQGLLESYLGKDPAARVFAGTVRRGEVLSVEAVLFYADLRAFTALADTLPDATSWRCSMTASTAWSAQSSAWVVRS